MKTDRILRRIIPSVPILARTPLAPILDIVDSFIRKSRPEWANLPPASLRMRIGLGNRILRNHQYFIESGKSIVSELAGKSYLSASSHVLELGCGCGRNASALLQFMGQNGSYVGQDVDHDMIRWCQGNIQREGCHFFHADLFSKVYNPGGKPISDYAFPVENGSITLIISVSVFSHLLQPDFEHYIRESKRVLAPGGCLHMTLFLMDYIRPRLGNRWTFSQRIQESYVETLRYPESAVAYDFETVDRILNENSLRIVELYNKELHQQTLIARKEQI